MKKILLIHTGGTIAMKENEESTVQLSDEHPLASFDKHITLPVKIETKQFTNLPSPSIDPNIVIDLANFIRTNVSEKNYDGIVITHGTDTLEETAYLLELLSPCEQPIILTGAMKSSTELGSDGPGNLLSAIRVAIHPDAHQLHVAVVMNDEIHAAKFVTKVHTSSVSAFESPLTGPAGIVTKQDVIFYYQPKKEDPISVKTIEKRVHLLKLYSGINDEIMKHIEAMNLDGLVIEAFGSGNVPSSIVPSLRRMIANNLPVVIVSRSLKGVVQPVYGYEGGGKQIENLGCIFARNLTGQKARLKLLLALHHTSDLHKLRQFFEKKSSAP